VLYTKQLHNYKENNRINDANLIKYEFKAALKV